MIKKLLFIFLLQMSFATCICAQKVIDWRATRDSIAKHADKFLDVEGLKLKPGLTMKKTMEMFEAIGWKTDPFYEVEDDDSQMHILKGESLGIKNCEMFITPTEKDKNIVGVIGIVYTESNSFKKLKETYDRVKESLSENIMCYQARNILKTRKRKTRHRIRKSLKHWLRTKPFLKQHLPF